jgi:small subunit ribosomal protein S21
VRKKSTLVPGPAVLARHVEVTPKKNESPERLVRRFSRLVRDEGVLDEFRQRSFFEKPSVKRRRKARLAARVARNSG